VSSEQWAVGSEQWAEGRRQKVRMTMKLSGFSFKTEAIWMVVFNFAPAVVGLLIVLLILVAMWLR